ncbi:MAG: hypothetical protein AB7K04_14345, partial [Pseudorhodoplanes sp.]
MPFARRLFPKAFALLCVAPLAMVLIGAQTRAQDYAAILAAPDRSEADRQNDQKREARKLLEFVGPKTGWRV